MPKITLSIPEEFESYRGSALTRFQYLHPEAEVESIGNEISITCADVAYLKRDLLHLLYRQKIYEETLELRTALYKKISNG